MKKILFSAYSMDVGGIETALLTLLKYLSDKYEITLVLEKKQGMFLEQIPKNVKIITYKVSDNKIVLFRKIINKYRQIKFKMKYGNKFDFAGSFATYSFACSYITRTASKNSALWVHNNYMDFYNNDLLKYRKFFKDVNVSKFKKVIFVSKLDKRIFNAQFPECSKKAEICNNLIDYNKIIDKSNEKIADMKKTDKVTFINVGRHDEKQKKLSRIIKATRQLNKEGYKFRVVFIGVGLDTNKYKNEAKDLKNIIFLGAKENPYPYIKQSDCVILSSQFEGYPVVFIEAQILEKPIITTDVSDSKQDIDGKYGIVVENSEEGVLNGMKEFLDKSFKTKKFDAEAYNKKIINELEKIIGE